MRYVIRLLAIFCCGLPILGTGPANAEKRVALAIGNGAYTKVGKLANPARDAAAIGTLLRTAGFDAVEVQTDLSAAAMRRALRDFSDRVIDADIAVVFFAGHGIEVNGTNYLIPVDAALERDIDVEDETVSLDRVTQMIDRAKRLRLVILDACRDNTFVQTMKRSGRSVSRGLARVDVVTSDTLIAFAARHGSTAADGVGANSPYTTALLKHLPTPGLDLRLALGRVRDDVLKSTGRQQEPFVYGSLGGAEIPLVAAANPVVVPLTRPQLSEAERAWAAAKDTTSVSALEAFVGRFGDTYYGDLAKMRLLELKQAEAAKKAEKEAQVIGKQEKRKGAEEARQVGAKRAKELPTPKQAINQATAPAAACARQCNIRNYCAEMKPGHTTETMYHRLRCESCHRECRTSGRHPPATGW